MSNFLVIWKFNFTIFLFRLIHEARVSRTPLDRFDFLSTEIAELSGGLAACSAQISVLQDHDVTATCRFYEEMDGRINTDNLNRLIIIGAPYFVFKTGDQVQEILKGQVSLI